MSVPGTRQPYVYVAPIGPLHATRLDSPEAPTLYPLSPVRYHPIEHPVFLRRYALHASVELCTFTSRFPVDDDPEVADMMRAEVARVLAPIVAEEMAGQFRWLFDRRLYVGSETVTVWGWRFRED